VTNFSTRIIDRMNVEWQSTGSSPESRRAASLLACREPEIAAIDADDLDLIVRRLRRANRPCERVWAARIVSAMLRSGNVHPLVPRAVLQAILPGLVSVARRLSWGDGGEWSDPGSFFSDLAATAWEVIREWSGQDRDYAVLDLLSAVRCRVRRQIVSQRDRRRRDVPGLEERTAGRSSWSTGTTDLDELARAIDGLSGRGIDPVDAAFLYGNRVLGYTVTELASMGRTSRRRVVTGRDRAAQRFVA
jgi:hypothetical protein